MTHQPNEFLYDSMFDDLEEIEDDYPDIPTVDFSDDILFGNEIPSQQFREQHQPPPPPPSYNPSQRMQPQVQHGRDLNLIAPGGVNLLSFEPLPPDPNAALLYSNISSRPMPAVISSVRSTPVISTSFSMANAVTANIDAHNPSTVSKLLPDGLTTPPPLLTLQMGGSDSAESGGKKVVKKRGPRKPRKQNLSSAATLPVDMDEDSAVSTANTVTSLTPGSTSGVKNLKDYVGRLLSHQVEQLADREFAERALLNLSRKLASVSHANFLSEWEKAIVQKDPSTECVTVTRPKDGRMTIAKTAGGGTCKKVFPQVFICQVFRWPNIIFHHDIKSADHCIHSAAIKPLIPNASLDGSVKDESMESGSEQICINPYHYVLTTEAETRFRKTSLKLARQSKVVQRPLQMSTNVSASFFEPSDDSDVSLADDTEEEDDDDVDSRIKMWDENVDNLDDVENVEIRPFDENQIMDEIKFLTLDEDKKVYKATEDDVIHELKLLEEIKDLIFSGKLAQKVLERKKEISAKVSSLNDTETKRPTLRLVAVEKLRASSFDKSPENSLSDLLADFQESFTRPMEEEYDGNAAAVIADSASNLLDDIGANIPNMVNPWPPSNTDSTPMARGQVLQGERGDSLIGAAISRDDLDTFFSGDDDDDVTVPGVALTSRSHAVNPPYDHPASDSSHYSNF